MEQHKEWLNAYIKRRMENAADSGPLELKRTHTFMVHENARLIAEEELADKRLVRATLLAALYHDIARFDQYLIYGTFKDAQSFNHGLEGARILRREGRFREEDPAIARLALAAVGLHNRRALPDILEKEARLPAQVTRDADKLDILRVLDESLAGGPCNPAIVLDLPDEPELCNPRLIKTIMKGQRASYADLRSVNDFRVLLGSWLFCLNFPASRKLFLSRGHARKLVEALPENDSYAQVKDYLLNTFERQKNEMKAD